MAQSARFRSAMILIVESETLVRMELVTSLTEMGLRVLAAANADEAIVLLDTHPEIEVLLTDIGMPGSMDGLKLAHHVRERWPPVKIIVTSGLLSTQLSDLPGESLFLPKPYGPVSLTEVLGRMIGGKDDGADARGGLRA
ncbi:MAG: putative response regulator [Caulobacter sp.]|nr:putative response regulator [Caulobacter sp.]